MSTLTLSTHQNRSLLISWVNGFCTIKKVHQNFAFCVTVTAFTVLHWDICWTKHLEHI